MKSNDSHRITIAIDGPAASGKSTVACALAARLGYLYFDTGVMYRAVTWAAMSRHIPIENEPEITRLAEEIDIQVEQPTVQDGRQYTVCADEEDVTWQIREPLVNLYVSPVSAYSGVRRALVAQQRRTGAQGGVIMVGRDIGTVVLPEAEVKVYLDASLRERARRRHAEVMARGQAIPYEDVLIELQRRDEIDSSRADSPLQIADGAVVIDSTAMTIEQVVAMILELAQEAFRRQSGEG